ncbi:MAG: prepilin-type N-terminal cleavage/methylation domain-containing protein [Candidatus Electrothrix sp. YB6]
MRLSDRHGFTLVELMVALAISSIIVAGIYAAYTSQQRINQAQDQIVEMQQNLRAGLDMMARELRMAGYDPDTTAGAGFTVANEKEVEFTRVINEATGALETIHYDLYDGYSDGQNDLGREVNSSNKRVLIENVENIEFLYTLKDGTLTVEPSSSQLSDIRSVTISVLVRSSGISLNYTNTDSYFPASYSDETLRETYWDPSPKDETTWWNPGPFNDSVRRRLQIIKVDCRNM